MHLFVQLFLLPYTFSLAVIFMSCHFLNSCSYNFFASYLPILLSYCFIHAFYSARQEVRSIMQLFCSNDAVLYRVVEMPKASRP